jgi:hypothetical protein
MARWCLLLASLLALPNVNAQNEEPKAVLGNMAGGTSHTSSEAVDFAFQRATEMAQASGRETPTLEHMLLAVLDDESVLEMFANQYIDPEVIRTSLLYHLPSTDPEPQASGRQQLDPALRDVMRRAVMKNMVTNRREVEAADIVVATLVEGDSYAARILSEQGLTVDEADNEALNSYLARQVEQSRRLEEMRERIAEENARQDQSGAVYSIRSSVVSGSGTASGPRLYTLRVISEDSEQETRFKAAVSHDGRLDLYIESTPFETEFLASQVAALFEAIENEGRLKVVLITEIEGQRRPITAFGGSAGAIFDDRDNLAGQRSGAL